MIKTNIKLINFILVIASLLWTTAIYAQQNLIKITGKISDTNGNPLIGATIQLKGGNTKTTTDSEGNYTLQAAPSSILIFSYVGYSSQEVSVPASGIMNITLAGEAVLDEVVVVGYGTTRKRDLTGGLSVVGQKELAMVSTTNLMDRLVGQVAGLNITTSNAAPGASQTLLIRGENSLSASNHPLIVLDGIPYSGSLVDLDPNTIENLTVLKDASAVAIYGSRGSNGVILVQTKRGIAGKPQVEVRLVWRNPCNTSRSWDLMSISVCNKI